jgi:hypothetical protein
MKTSVIVAASVGTVVTGFLGKRSCLYHDLLPIPPLFISIFCREKLYPIDLFVIDMLS